MTYTGTGSSTGEAAIRNQAYFFGKTHPNDSSRSRQHFTHARAAFRAFVTDDDDIARINLAAINSFYSFFFLIEHAGRTLMMHHFRCNCRFFANSSCRSQAAIKNFKTAGLRAGMCRIMDNRIVNDFPVGNIFFHRCCRYRQAVAMNQAEVIQFFHDSFYTAGIMEISRIAAMCSRFDSHEMRNLFCQFIEDVDIEINACGMSQCCQMKYRIGRAADCHVEGNGIFNGFFRNNLTGQDIFFKEFHDFHACPFSQCQSLTGCSQII